MARMATTADIFNAIAEPRRRAILELLARGERTVTEIAHGLGMAQPQASKHLKVLREVGLVTLREAGKQHVYRLNAMRLKPVYDWTASFERFWQESFERLDELLVELKQEKESPHDLE